MDPLDIIGRIGTDNAPSDAQLSEAFAAIRETLDVVTSADKIDLDLAKDLRAGLDTVKGEIDARKTAQDEARAQAAALREGIFDAPKVEEAAQVDEVEEAPAVVASPADALARLRQHAARVQVIEPEPVAAGSAVSVKVTGPAAGFDLGDDPTLGNVAQAFSLHAKSLMGNGSVTLARVQKHYSADRTLGQNVDLNNSRLSAVFGAGIGKSPVAASGGLCGPGDVDFSNPIVSTGGRPIRDALPQFNAARGRLSYMPAVSVGDLSSAVSIWTSATDASPGANTKPCPPLACPTELTAAVDAVVRCLTVGNFQATFSPEFWEARLATLLIAHDRLAEQKSIEEIHAASTDAGAVNKGSTLKSFLFALNDLVARDRSAHRNTDGQYIVVADAFIRNAIRNAAIIGSGVSNNIDILGDVDSYIDRALGNIGVKAVWTEDGSWTGSAHRVLAPGTAATTGGAYLFNEDAFLFLDGGTLDLGTSITDSALNATNDRQAFAETFERTAFRGASSYRFTVPVAEQCGCPAP